MKKLLLLISCFLVSFISLGQCPGGNITLTTQAEVDDFVLTYPNCTELLGNLFIDGNSITNLKGLAVITSIEGRFEIRNTQILDFMGLEFLETVEGTFDVSNNDALIDFSGLDLLTSVIRFFVYENASLKSLDGIDSLTTIEEEESILIVDNNSLISINALSTVVNCPGCAIIIEDNPNLTNLEGLGNIPPTDMFFLRLVDNPNLVVCNLQNICTFLLDGGDNVIENNASGCSSAAEIMDNCFFSIAETSIDDLIILAPNPVSEILQIKTSQGIVVTEVRIYSIQGKQLLVTPDLSSEASAEGGKKINLNSLSLGAYFAIIETAQGTVIKKIIKN